MNRRKFMAAAAVAVSGTPALAKKYRPKPIKPRLGNVYRDENNVGYIVDRIGNSSGENSKLFVARFPSKKNGWHYLMTSWTWIDGIPKNWKLVGNVIDDYLR